MGSGKKKRSRAGEEEVERVREELEGEDGLEASSPKKRKPDEEHLTKLVSLLQDSLIAGII